jgi:hypothetical protein
LALSTAPLFGGGPWITSEAYARDAPRDIPRLDALGRWNLEDLGTAPFAFGTSDDSAKRSLLFLVPKETAEEPGVDFLVDLRLSLQLAQGSGEGFAIFSVFINGEAGEQVTVEATRNSRNELEARWSTADLFFGPRSEPFESRRAEIDVRNFTPLPGVKPGVNDFSVQFERGGKIEFAKALVKKATGLEVTHARPPALKVEPELPRDLAVKGKPFEVKFRLQNAGTVPARAVSVRLESSSPKLLTIEGSDSFSFERLLAEKEVSFRVRGQEYGTYKLTLDVASRNANSPVAVIETPIVRARNRPDSPWTLIALLVGLVAVVGWGTYRLVGKRKQ